MTEQVQITHLWRWLELIGSVEEIADFCKASKYAIFDKSNACKHIQAQNTQ